MNCIHQQSGGVRNNRRKQSDSALYDALGGEEEELFKDFTVTPLANPFSSKGEMILIRQSLYEAKTMSLSKKEPITFDDAGTSGIPLDMALSFTVPEGWKTEYMRCLSGTKKTIRINWPGYPPWNMAINVSDDTCNRNPVTKAKLTHNVAKAVKKFLDEHHNKRQCKPNEWAIGKNIKLSDISLGMLSHVSEGSLQPTLYITESALLRSPHE